MVRKNKRLLVRSDLQRIENNNYQALGSKHNPYIKVGKYNNITIYKKKNMFYVRVKDSINKMVYKRLTKSMINSIRNETWMK